MEDEELSHHEEPVETVAMPQPPSDDSKTSSSEDIKPSSDDAKPLSDDSKPISVDSNTRVIALESRVAELEGTTRSLEGAVNNLTAQVLRLTSMLEDVTKSTHDKTSEPSKTPRGETWATHTTHTTGGKPKTRPFRSVSTYGPDTEDAAAAATAAVLATSGVSSPPPRPRTTRPGTAASSTTGTTKPVVLPARPKSAGPSMPPARQMAAATTTAMTKKTPTVKKDDGAPKTPRGTGSEDGESRRGSIPTSGASAFSPPATKKAASASAPTTPNNSDAKVIKTAQSKSPATKKISAKGIPAPDVNLRPEGMERSAASIEEHYDVKEALGSGGFSTVHLGIEKVSGKEWALKRIKRATVEANAADIKREVSILQRLDHPNIVKLHEVLDTPPELCISMELMRGGELFDRIVSRGSYSEKDTSRVLRKIVSALAHIHSKGVAHCDLKPENLIYTSGEDSAELKIIDFGLAHFVGPTAEAGDKTITGTPEYIAPEVVMRKGYSNSCDMWSVGVIMYILLCGYYPYYGSSPQEILWKVCFSKPDFPEKDWSKISTSAKDLISRLLQKEPAQRYTAEQTLKHPWIKGTAAPETAMPDTTIANLRAFNARRRFRKGVFAAMAISKFSWGIGKGRAGSVPSPVPGQHPATVPEEESNSSALNSENNSPKSETSSTAHPHQPQTPSRIPTLSGRKSSVKEPQQQANIVGMMSPTTKKTSTKIAGDITPGKKSASPKIDRLLNDNVLARKQTSLGPVEINLHEFGAQLNNTNNNPCPNTTTTTANTNNNNSTWPNTPTKAEVHTEPMMNPAAAS
mmetsp:Transcript_9002/g.15352  ORF Transcript_9002/g.15352 Transcript_9002/m.15352 type:complete len:804 (+) Transcript_9002:196-2607(+)|eukprot:CAMPEP_0184334296 /NCGR_PEP_ID=MMETSP1089-20130417/3140_1 /TAXON_ID=38269 ORGANISM="Gloeochaete wittrockiana, Strain SAG46.84" /NCGR_SAMPLE_ID=MMETSP1089 /ASSEMBLY_ACC=CAM_ASM_000445 /LENGTH=803 /DNA_ID=CAMNT_0026658523 /DNA_START=132 /DNA_END=2543 /DNA_ORIENTATION=-